MPFFTEHLRNNCKKEKSLPNKKGFVCTQAFDYIGGTGEIRTRDQRIKSPLLYRLSYRPQTKP